MSESRAFSASVVLYKSYLWITGGLDQDFQPLNSTEIIDITSQKSFPSSNITLPVKLHLHCLIKINEKQMLLVGGLGFDGPQVG